MSIKLDWSDNSAAEEEHKIYRDTDPMDPNALPAALQTVGANIETFTDDTAVQNTEYFYRVSSKAGAVEKVSSEVSIVAASEPTGFYPVMIEQALRINSADSPSLTRTYTTSSTVTIHFAIKRCGLGTEQPILGSYLKFNADDTITAFGLTTSAKFRDTNGWYFGTLSNNGLEINGANHGAVTTAAITNAAIGTDGSNYADFYLARLVIIDGTSYPGSTFYELKNKVWIAKSLTVSYGTEGGLYEFSDPASPSADTSGNDNDFTANNLNSWDVVPDSPTNNWCTINTLAVSAATPTLSEGNLKVTTKVTGSDAFGSIAIPSSGLWYWEVTPLSAIDIFMIGVAAYDATATYAWLSAGSVAYYANGEKYVDGVGSSYGAAYTQYDTIGIAVDAGAKTITFYKGTSPQGTISYDAAGLFPYVSDGSGSDACTLMLNFGQDSTFAGNTTAGGFTDANGLGDFKHQPPAGALALCAANLPEPTISPNIDENSTGTQADDHFKVMLDTGANIKITAEAEFTYFMEWIKDRANANNHQAIDTLRGLSAVLQTNTTAAETTYSIPAGSSVAWLFNALTAPVSNAVGSISSLVSANADAGFSLGTFSNGNGTVGHGLTKPLEMLLVKCTNAIAGFYVYHAGIASDAETDYLLLNDTPAPADANTIWNDTAPTDSVFSVGSSFAGAYDYAFYAFHSVDGYSKAFRFDANANIDGTFIHLNFYARWILLTRIDSSGNRLIYDTERKEFNVLDVALEANTPNSEPTVGTNIAIDVVSNGFKCRTTDADVNASGGKYVGFAIAAVPFKYANAA